MSSPRRPSVLVVDDEPLIVALLKAALEHNGISTAAAGNAQQACELFETHHASIKVLVSDVIMPETNGIQLAERLLEEKPELKVVFISGYCSTYESALRGFECLAKPFRTNEVVGRIRRLLELAGGLPQGCHEAAEAEC